MPGSSPGMTNSSTSLLFTTGHWSLQLLHLSHLEFHPRRAAEDGDRDLEPRAPVVDFLLHALFGRHHDLFEQVIEMALLGLLADRLGHLALEIRIGLDDVPVLVGHSAGSFNRRCRE